jgi:hypothetical protein
MSTEPKVEDDCLVASELSLTNLKTDLNLNKINLQSINSVDLSHNQLTYETIRYMFNFNNKIVIYFCVFQCLYCYFFLYKPFLVCCTF